MHCYFSLSLSMVILSCLFEVNILNHLHDMHFSCENYDDIKRD